MSIRAYQQSDYPALLSVYANAKLDELRFEKHSYQFLPLEQDEKRHASLMESDIYVYQQGSVIVAYLAIYQSEIRSLFVHSSARKQGIGKQLLEFALSQIEGPISLNVAKSNTPAKDLYSKYGFHVSGEFIASYNDVEAIANTMRRP